MHHNSRCVGERIKEKWSFGTDYLQTTVKESLQILLNQNFV